VLRQTPGFFPWFGVNGDSRGAVVPSLWINLTFADEGRTRSISLNPSVSFRFGTRLQASIGAGLSSTDDHTQWFGNFADEQGGELHHSFAHLDQQTSSMSVRFNYTATPELTLEFYGQPFVSRVTYSEFRELSATPEAGRYDDRFRPFDPPANADRAFRFMQLRTNAVLRWEYRPGSTLFLVWSHGRQDRVGEASQASWLTEYRDLLDLRPDNTFLIKLAYWLNR